MSILAAIEDQEGIIRPPRFNNKVSSTRPEQDVTLKDFAASCRVPSPLIHSVGLPVSWSRNEQGCRVTTIAGRKRDGSNGEG